ncbi:hypothetical protein [Caulobacter sp.]|uniref:hypothetical protein n=1 Tax=Caulobacter sp. TaxID=78 RepID=UPI001B28DDAB|nr:hypothetical protein [Caulobacter sp.]MBO9545892.1 hypothetical protein [Caulobacter sp.]
MRTSNVVYAFDTDFRALNDDEIDFVSGGDGTPSNVGTGGTGGTTTTTTSWGIKITTPVGGVEITRKTEVTKKPASDTGSGGSGTSGGTSAGGTSGGSGTSGGTSGGTYGPQP